MFKNMVNIIEKDCEYIVCKLEVDASHDISS